jgi:GGDEF domain-containing protein
MMLPHALAGSDDNAARAVDGKLRQQLAKLATQLHFSLDFSSGLALRQADETLEQLMQRADTALYDAKQNGRGQLSLA